MPSFNPPALWEAKPHTLAKIEILGRYLYLWFSILGTNPRNKRLVYIDGFAGPGQYTNTGQSSPIAALRAAKNAIERPGARLKDVEFSFLFVEKRKDFVENLRAVVLASSWPTNIKWDTEQGSFEERVGGVLEELKRQRQQLAPTFAFIDPFGATGLPFHIVAEILSHPSCEVLLNLDSDGIGRLVTAQEFAKNQKNLDAIFGDQSWQQLDPAWPMPKLSAAILTLYKQRLRSLQAVRLCVPIRHEQPARADQLSSCFCQSASAWPGKDERSDESGGQIGILLIFGRFRRARVIVRLRLSRRVGGKNAGHIVWRMATVC